MPSIDDSPSLEIDSLVSTHLDVNPALLCCVHDLDEIGTSTERQKKKKWQWSLSKEIWELMKKGRHSNNAMTTTPGLGSMEVQQSESAAHVLLLPFPAQGHIASMLSFAQLLCHACIHVTLLSTEHNHCLLTQRRALSAHFPTLHFERHRLVAQVRNQAMRDLLITLTEKDNESYGATTSRRPRSSCVIIDGMMCFAIDVAEKVVGVGRSSSDSAVMEKALVALDKGTICSSWNYSGQRLASGSADETLPSLTHATLVLRPSPAPQNPRCTYEVVGIVKIAWVPSKFSTAVACVCADGTLSLRELLKMHNLFNGKEFYFTVNSHVKKGEESYLGLLTSLTASSST
ncbi:hypothetical protein ACFX13_009931 [Malus domestica]